MDGSSEERSNAALAIQDHVAPILIAYTAWVLREAIEKGERLYFVARDAQILWKIANILVNAFDLPVKCSYMHGSRRSWSRATVKNCVHEELLWAYGPFGCSAREALLRIGMEKEEVSRLVRKDSVYGKEFLPSQYSFLTDLLREPLLRKRVLDISKGHRDALCQYLDQEGMFGHEDWALVDVGWTLGAQSTMARIVADKVVNDNVRGYYLCVAKNRAPRNIAGAAHAFISQSDDDLVSQMKSDWVFSQHGHAVLEYIALRADHETTVGFMIDEGAAKPIFDTSKIDAFTLEMIGIVQSTIEGCARSITSGMSFKDILSDKFKEEAFLSFKEFCIHPSVDQVGPFIGMNAMDGAPFDADRPHKFIRRLSFGDLMGLFMKRVGIGSVRSTLPPHNWWPACAAISGDIYSRVYRALHVERPIMPKVRRSF